MTPTERELVEHSVKTVGQILSNYQAALHLFEQAVTGETVPRARALEMLQQASRDVFVPVLEACAGVAPGLDDLVAESIGRTDAAADEGAQTLPDLVIAERERVAITHSRLITRQAGLMDTAEPRADRAALEVAAGRLDELEAGSHSAGALFNLLRERWRELR